MKYAFLAGITALAALGLAGCASTLPTDVTQFHNPNAAYWGKSFALLADPDQAASLEFKTDAGLVSTQLQAHGMTPEPDVQGAKPGTPPAGKDGQSDTADLLVTVSFHPIGSRVEYWAYEEPVFPGFYHSWATQSYMTGGSQVFTRMELEVTMYDGPAWRKGQKVMLFDGRASAETGAAEPNLIVKPLVDALFETFPAPSGQTRRIDLELE